MIDLKRPRLSVVRQCTLLQLNRSGAYYPACATERGLSGVDAADRGPVPGNAVLWLPADDMASAPPRT